MSANITAASTSWRRTGWSVTSAQSSVSAQISKSDACLRSSRYSGSERPAWRMNQTGVRSTGSRRAARTRRGSGTNLGYPRVSQSPTAGTVALLLADDEDDDGALQILLREPVERDTRAIPKSLPNRFASAS